MECLKEPVQDRCGAIPDRFDIPACGLNVIGTAPAPRTTGPCSEEVSASRDTFG